MVIFYIIMLPDIRDIFANAAANNNEALRCAASFGHTEGYLLMMRFC